MGLTPSLLQGIAVALRVVSVKHLTVVLDQLQVYSAVLTDKDSSAILKLMKVTAFPGALPASHTKLSKASPRPSLPAPPRPRDSPGYKCFSFPLTSCGAVSSCPPCPLLPHIHASGHGIPSCTLPPPLPAAHHSTTVSSPLHPLGNLVLSEPPTPHQARKIR